MWGRMRRWWNRQDPLRRRDAAIGSIVFGVGWTFYFSLPERLSVRSTGLGLALGLNYGAATLFGGWWDRRRRRRRDGGETLDAHSPLQRLWRRLQRALGRP